MRVAVFSDVHGNALALEAVLADVERVGGVDAYWFVGDAASQGYDPAGCVQRISTLPGLKAVRGNTDRYTVTDRHPLDASFLDIANRDLARAQTMYAMARNFAWTRGALTATGNYDWLANLPVEERVILPDGTRLLLVHAAPGTDDGSGIKEDQSETVLENILAPANADLVIVGHTHDPLSRIVNGIHAWNLGSVSLPFREVDDKRAMWTLLEADDSGHTLTRQYAEYDGAEVVRQLEAAHQPVLDIVRKAWEE
jgi:predicted phosphodiesterase